MSASDVISTSFSEKLAAILFDTPANPDREAQEVEIVSKFEKWIMASDRKQIWAMSIYIDQSIIPLLSGKNLLHVAKLLEDRAPTVIANMTNLRKHQAHLQRTAELAEILSPKSMERLIKAIKASKDTAQGVA